MITNQDVRRLECTGKKAYGTASLAKAVARSASKRLGHMYHYQCRFCHLWHLASSKHNPRNIKSSRRHLRELEGMA